MDNPFGSLSVATDTLGNMRAYSFPVGQTPDPGGPIVGRAGRTGRFDRDITEWAIPHQFTYASIYNLYSKTYRSYFDEALKASYQDALALRRDPMVGGYLQNRTLPVAALNYRVEPDDADDPGQAKAAARAQKLYESTPRMIDLKTWLLEATYFGKSGVQLIYGRKMVGGERSNVVVDHSPVNGDKIIWHWDGTPSVLVNASWRPESGRDAEDYADRGTIYTLRDPYDRRQFAIHRFRPSDADYMFESDLAGQVGGLGLRGRIYHAWWLRVEVLSWFLDGLQRIGSNGQRYAFYDEGSPASMNAVIDALRQLNRDNVAAFPRKPGSTDSTIVSVPPTDVAYNVMLEVIQYFDEIIRRLILGQDLSSTTAPTGLGSGVAKLHQDVLNTIIRTDAISLGETETDDLLGPLIAYNDWEYRGKKYKGHLPFQLKIRPVLDSDDALTLIQVAQGLVGLGVPIDLEDLREKCGQAPPKDGPANQGMPGGPPDPNAPPPPDPTPQEARLGPPRPRAAPRVPSRRRRRPRASQGLQEASSSTGRAEASSDILTLLVPTLVVKPPRKLKGDGVSHGIFDGRKKVGHISGYERDSRFDRESKKNVGLPHFDVVKTEIDEPYRGQGHYRAALQRVADRYPDGVKSAKFQTSRAFAATMRKMPTFHEDDEHFWVKPTPKVEYASDRDLVRYAGGKSSTTQVEPPMRKAGEPSPEVPARPPGRAIMDDVPGGMQKRLPLGGKDKPPAIPRAGSAGQEINDRNDPRFDERGKDIEGFSRRGLAEAGHDRRNWYPDDDERPGKFDATGFDSEGYDRGGLNSERLDRLGYHSPENDERYDIHGRDEGGYDRGGLDEYGNQRDEDEYEDDDGEIDPDAEEYDPDHDEDDEFHPDKGRYEPLVTRHVAQAFEHYTGVETDGNDVVGAMGLDANEDHDVDVEHMYDDGSGRYVAEVRATLAGRRGYMIRSFNFDKVNGRHFIHNDVFRVAQADRGKGFGMESLTRQVEHAVRMGFTHIECDAARSDGGENAWVGYKVWPKFGYDAELPQNTRNSLPAGLKDCGTLLDLYATPEGQAWWEENGDSINVKLDLTPGSASLEVLDAYRASKGLPPIKQDRKKYGRSVDTSVIHRYNDEGSTSASGGARRWESDLGTSGSRAGSGTTPTTAGSGTTPTSPRRSRPAASRPSARSWRGDGPRPSGPGASEVVRYGGKGSGDHRVMVALKVPNYAARQVAVKGGTKPGDMHVTLAYLGRRSTIGRHGLDAVRRLLEKLAHAHRPISGHVGGRVVFPPSKTSGGLVPVACSVDVPGLSELRQRIVEGLDLVGVEPRSDHGFTPHVTLRYEKPDVLGFNIPTAGDAEPVDFPAVFLVVGGKWESFRFTGEKTLRYGKGDDPATTGKSSNPVPAEPEIPPPTPDHLYHVTNLDNAGQIAGDKLRTFRPWHGTDQASWPDGSTARRSYWSHDPKVAEQFTPEGQPAMLRARKGLRRAGKPVFDREAHTGDHVSHTPIPSRHLEIHLGDGRWQPLDEWAKGDLADPAKVRYMKTDPPACPDCGGPSFLVRPTEAGNAMCRDCKKIFHDGGVASVRYADDETEQGAPPPRAVGVDTASQVEAGKMPGLKIMPPRRKKYAAGQNPAAVTAQPWLNAQPGPAAKPSPARPTASGELPDFPEARKNAPRPGGQKAPTPEAGADPRAAEDWRTHGTNSDAFISWFGDWRNDPENSSRAVHPTTGEPHRTEPISHARDAEGRPIIVHHGTTHEFEAFDRSKANPENHMGNGFYFSSDPHDSDKNYAGVGPDLTSKIDARTEKIANEAADDPEGWLAANRGRLPDEFRDLDAATMTSQRGDWGHASKFEKLFENMARADLVGDKPHTKSFYLNLRNPVVLDKKGGTRFGVDYPDGDVDEDGNAEPDYDNPSGKGHDLAQAIRDIAGDYDEEDGEPADADQIIHNLGLYEGDDQTAHELFERLAESNPSLGKEDPGTGDRQYLMGQFLKEAFQRMGHDGIIYNDAHQYFPKMVKPGTRHYVAFHPHQVKSVDNRGTFDPQDVRFRYDEDGPAPLPPAAAPAPKARKPRSPKAASGKSSTPPPASPASPPAPAGVLPAGHPAHTPEFKNWFGPWDTDPEGSSKVVHPEGHPREEYELPKVVYHGTPRGGFDRFDPAKDKGGNLFGRGFYFTEDPDVAREYTRKDMKVSGHHLNSLVVPKTSRHEAFEQYLKSVGDHPWSTPESRENAIGEAEGNRADFMKHGSIFHMIRPDYSRYEPWHKNTTDPKTRAKLRESYRQMGLGKDLDKEYEDWELLHATSVAEKHGFEMNPNAEVKRAYLNIRNPYDMDLPAGKRDFDDHMKWVAQAQKSGRTVPAYGQKREIHTPYYKHVADKIPDDVAAKHRKRLGRMDDVNATWKRTQALAAAFHDVHPEIFPDPTGETMTRQGLAWLMTDGGSSGIGKGTVNERIRDMGHDGMSHTGGWNVGTKAHKVWIAMHPNQIKSTGNRGSFDPSDERVDYAEGDAVDRERMARNVVERLPAGRFTTEDRPLVVRMGEDVPAPAPPAATALAEPRPRVAKATATMTPHPDVARSANAYAAPRGLPSHGPLDYRPLDINRSMAIADAYEAAPHAPGDPGTQASYEALKRETADQYRHLSDEGARLEPWSAEGQPYADSKAMRDDVIGNRHLYFYTGGDMPRDHPMAGPSGVEHGGRPLTHNDLFRAVHDWYGHALYGNEFGPRGEEHAWRTHSRMFSPEARPAMTSETRGQNSWVNFGGHLRDAEGRVIRKGEPGYVPATERPYAEQKAALLPPGFNDDDAPMRRYAADRPWSDDEERDLSRHRLIAPPVVRMARNVVERLPAGRFTTKDRPLVVRMGEDGVPRLALRSRVRYEDKAGVRHAPKGGITIDGEQFPGGEYVPTRALAAATPQQLATLGMTPETAMAAMRAEGVAPHPNAYGPGVSRGNKVVVTPDMLPEDMRDTVHVENLAAITTRAGLDEFVSLYEQTKSACGGLIPSQDVLEALARSGESVKGHYQEFLHGLTRVFGVDGAKVWAVANGILSSQTSWIEHTMGSFRLVGEWIAAGRPKDAKTIDALIDKWKNIRKTGTDPEIGPVAYSLFDKVKRAKLTALMMDPEGFSLKQMGNNHWAKTNEFSGSFMDGSKVAIDAHMGKLLGMGDAVRDTKALLKTVAASAPRYSAYKSAVAKVAQKLGWRPSEVQEAVWGSVLGIACMKRHGATSSEVDRFLTHGTVGQTWDMNEVLNMPELDDVFRKIPGFSESDRADLGRQGPSQGGLQARGLKADRAVSVPDAAAFRRAVEAIGPAESGAAQGVRPVLPKGGVPAGWNPDEAYFKKPTEAPDEKAMKATIASRGRRQKEIDAKAAGTPLPPGKKRKRSARDVTIGSLLIRYLRPIRAS